MMREYERFDGVELARRVRSRELRASELVEAAIARLEERDGALNAVIHLHLDRAREQARALDERRPDHPLPLHGVPFLLKDLGGQEEGQPCHMGMRILKEHDIRESQDSYFVQRARAAGLVALGRTNTPELGLLPTSEPVAHGPTRNPWSLEHSAGGSSGGAGAAVAAGIVPLAHASDGGGSIRIPAAHCGLVGLKPTRGRCSFGPGAGERWSGFSCELVVSRSVRDTAAFLDAAGGGMPGDPYFAPPPREPFLRMMHRLDRRLRVGVMTGAPRTDITVHSACAGAARRAAQLLEEDGHHVEESGPRALGDIEAVRTYAGVVSNNVARMLEVVGERIGRPLSAEDVEPLTWSLAEIGWSRTATEHLALVESVHAFGRCVGEWWASGFDLLVTPTTAQPAPRIGELTCPRDEPLLGFYRSAPYGVFTSPFNMTGQPAISLPLGYTEEGLPTGAQIVAPYGREDLLLQVAARIEQAAPWMNRRPPGFA